MKDAHDDPYKAQKRPFVLPCVECGEELLVAGLRRVEGMTYNTPYDPLCAECLDIEHRVWGTERIITNWLPPEPWKIGPYDFPDDDDPNTRWFVVLCYRCNGQGTVLGGMCFECSGYRYTILSDKGVRRTARWWQTYQQNRVDRAKR